MGLESAVNVFVNVWQTASSLVARGLEVALHAQVTGSQPVLKKSFAFVYHFVGILW
jgi:hypothetical protein